MSVPPLHLTPAQAGALASLREDNEL